MDGLGMNKNEAAMTWTPGLGGTGKAHCSPPLERVKTSFAPDRSDSYLALPAFVLGFFYPLGILSGRARVTCLPCYSGWPMTVYMLKKVQIPRASWFHTVMLLGLNFSLWTNNGLAPCTVCSYSAAPYWVMCCRLLILGKPAIPLPIWL